MHVGDGLRKIKLVRVVVPELVTCFMHKGEKILDFHCPVCGFGVEDDCARCPHCASELDWNREDKKSKEFRDMINGL